MSVSRRAVAVAVKLLESDLDFHNVLRTSDGNLSLEGATNNWKTSPQGVGGYDEAVGQLEIWWTVTFESRDWGIKDIVPVVKKLQLDGWFEYADANGDMADSGERFHYEYPAERSSNEEIGPDVDEPTPANVYRLAELDWKVKTIVDPYAETRTVFAPKAEVNLTRREIKITF